MHEQLHITGEGCAKQGIYEHSYAIRFAHCDPAGIVFYPQYFVLANGLVEDWFSQGLGVNYADMISERKVGLPIVSLKCEFAAPSRMGEAVSFRLSTSRVGKRSISLDIEAAGKDGLRLKMQQTLVTTSLETHQSIDIPSDILDAIHRWQLTSGT